MQLWTGYQCWRFVVTLDEGALKDDSRQCILNTLESFNIGRRCATKDGVSIVQFGTNDCTAKGYCYILSESCANVTERVQVIEGSTIILCWFDPEKWAVCRVLLQEFSLCYGFTEVPAFPATFTCVRVDWELSLLWVTKRTASVLSGLRVRPLWQNQAQRWERQFWRESRYCIKSGVW